MRFTTDRPREPGFYFMKFDTSMGLGKRNMHMTVVHAYYCGEIGCTNQPEHPNPNVVFWDGENVSITDECLVAFAGPIPPPLEKCPGCGQSLDMNGGCPNIKCSQEHVAVKT